MEIKRGQIYYADLSPVVGSEQGGVRPVLIIQNDVGNKYSPTVIATAITSQMTKAKLPTHIEVPKGSFGLPKDSVILLEQIRTLDKRRLRESYRLQKGLADGTEGMDIMFVYNSREILPFKDIYSQVGQILTKVRKP